MSLRAARLILLLPILAAASDKHWETAKVISQDLNSQPAGAYAAPIGNGTVAVPLYRTSNTVLVEVGEYEMRWVESGRAAIVLPVHDEIRFYREKDAFIVLDSKNHKHKFTLIGMTKKTAQ